MASKQQPHVVEIPNGARFGKNGFNMHARVTPQGGSAVWNEFHKNGTSDHVKSKEIVETVVNTHLTLAQKNGASEQAVQKWAASVENPFDLNAEKIAKDAVYDAKIDRSGAYLTLVTAVPVTILAVVAFIATGTLNIPLAALAAIQWTYFAYDRFVKPKHNVAKQMNKQISSVLEKHKA
jgi:hypothetical protein